uniref:Hypoxia up-regulated protein 1 n=1 Tax=Panagrolaimus davidi TaxID=227884 RepID=A0A914R7B0_9BILA
MLTLKVLENNDTFIKCETTIGTRKICPEHIAAALFEYIKEKVEEFEGSQRDRVMITIPSTLTDSQKDSTCVAAIIAKFDVVDFMPEPVAAAFGYLIDQPPTDHNFTFLLFDLGGGTLDICIFKYERNEIEIFCQNGNQNFGGRDFDNILIDYFSQKFFYDYGINDFGSKKYKLMLECQKIKEILSICDEALYVFPNNKSKMITSSFSLDIEEIVSSIEKTIEITRREFEELSTELLEKISTCVIDALEECKFKAENINKILLVGGGSRMPMIKELLKNMFPNSKHLCAKNPEEMIAVGAAYYSCYLASLLIEDKKMLELYCYLNESEEENEEEISSDEK